jgi:biopolymer transport protein ExbB
MASLTDFIVHHFTQAAPIFITGAIALVIILERMQAIVWDYSFPYGEAFFEKIRYMVLADRVAEAITFCEQLAHKPLVRVVREGLLRAHQPDSIVEHGLRIAVGEVSERIQERIGFLRPLALVAFLFGLLGTTIGIRQVGEALGPADTFPALSAALASTLNAMVLGLSVAIPSLCAHAFLASRSRRLVADIDVTAIRMQDLIKQRYYAVAPKSDVPGSPTSQPVTRVPRTGTGRSSRGF